MGRLSGCWRLLAGATLALVVTTACSDDPSAEERVCDARSDLRTAVDDVVADVADANLGDARDGVADVRESVDELSAAVDDLAEQERSALAPEVEALRSDIGTLVDASSLEELSAGLQTVLAETQAIVDDVTSTLQCG